MYGLFCFCFKSKLFSPIRLRGISIGNPSCAVECAWESESSLNRLVQLGCWIVSVALGPQSGCVLGAGCG